MNAINTAPTVVFVSSVFVALGLSLDVYAQASDVDCIKCVDTKDIASGAVTTGRIENKAVTASKIDAKAVNASKLANRAVTTNKIKDGAVTADKVAPPLKNAIGTFCPPGQFAVGMDMDGNFVCEPKGSAGGAVQVLANGESIGIFLEASGGTYVTLSSTGYMFAVRLNTNASTGPSGEWVPGDIVSAGVLRYKFPDCLGSAFIEIWDNGTLPAHWSWGFELMPTEGIVVATGDPLNPIQYAPEGSEATTHPDIMSQRVFTGECENYPHEMIGVQVFPNDPAITGVPNEPFTPPITLGQ